MTPVAGGLHVASWGRGSSLTYAVTCGVAGAWACPQHPTIAHVHTAAAAGRPQATRLPRAAPVEAVRRGRLHIQGGGASYISVA